jgi:hypothetical protein
MSVQFDVILRDRESEFRSLTTRRQVKVIFSVGI